METVLLINGCVTPPLNARMDPMSTTVPVQSILSSVSTDSVLMRPAQTRCSAQEDRFQDPTLEKSTLVVEAVVDMAASLADLRSSHVKSVDNVYQRKSCVNSSQTVLYIQADEKDCQIVQITGTCRMNEFECSPNVCIHESWVCDGRADCRDGADEAEGHQCRPDTKCQSNASIGNASIEGSSATVITWMLALSQVQCNGLRRPEDSTARSEKQIERWN